jgi:hypothetical protein
MITPENTEAFLEGLAILGTGGGGSPDWGRRIMRHDVEQGRSATFVEPEDVPDGALVASGGIMGSVKVLDQVDPDELLRRWDQRFELADAFRLMERTIGRKVDYVVPFEAGGLNTPVILSLGARTGIPVINGDGLGRSAPETNMVSFIGYGVSLTPMPLIDAQGNQVVVLHGTENTYADRLGRWVVTHGGGLGANSHYPMSGAQLKRSVVPHTLSKALALGERVLEARRAGTDPVAAAADELGGRHLHTGMLESIVADEWEGFYFTRALLSGGIEIVIKNEAMALFVRDRPAAIFPDLVCMLDPHSGRGLMSADLKPGDEIALIVTACHPRLRGALDSSEGRAAFAPARFGRPELVYRPLEELLLEL